ncbi:MAG: Hsp33 family molecular chaperone HslO [Deltaproteobacteria bacterium]|nr:Hsp33 family molecular chaperone HslO [Deltaproteobacteria bacterium]
MGDRWVRRMARDGLTRVSVAVMDGAVETARTCHRATPIATVALGRAMVAATLISSTLRDEGRVNLQIVGNGPLGAVAVDAAASGTVRGSVRCPMVLIPIGTSARARVAPGLGHSGLLHVLLDPHGGQYVRGSCELVDGEVDADVEAYLHQSAQLASAFGTDVRIRADRAAVERAVGVLVQAMPGSDGKQVEDAQARLRDGGLARLLGDGPLPDPNEIVQRVVDGAAYKDAEERAVRWFCPCSRERVKDALAAVGRDEVRAIIDEVGQAEATCDFCRSVYVIPGAELEQLLTTMAARATRSS